MYLRFSKYHLIFILFLFCSVFFITSPQMVFADPPGEDLNAPTTLPDPLNLPANGVNVLIGRVINGILGIVGSLALAMFVYGGFTWMLSAGNADNIQKGKNILIWATVGLVVIFTSYALVKFVLTSLSGA